MKKLVSFIVLLSIPLLLEAAGSRQGVWARFKEGVNNKRTAVKNEYTAIRNDRKERALQKRKEVEEKLDENLEKQKKIIKEGERKKADYDKKNGGSFSQFSDRSAEITADGKQLRSLIKESGKLQKALKKLDRQDKFNNSKISGFVDGVKVSLRATGRGIASAGSGVATGAQRVGEAVAAPVSKFGREVSKQYNQNQASRAPKTPLAISSSSPRSSFGPSTTFGSKVVDAVVAPFQVSGRGIASAFRGGAKNRRDKQSDQVDNPSENAIREVSRLSSNRGSQQYGTFDRNNPSYRDRI